MVPPLCEYEGLFADKVSLARFLKCLKYGETQIAAELIYFNFANIHPDQ